MTWTPNFAESEFLRSATAARLDIALAWSMPEHRANALRLTRRILEPLRARVLRPVHITSGYRNMQLTHALRAAGYSASLTSDHLTGCAADIVVKGMTNEEVATHIFNLAAEGVIDTYHQLIWYHPNTGGSCHVSLRAAGSEREALERTVHGYLPWMPTPVPRDDVLVGELTGLGGLLGASVQP